MDILNTIQSALAGGKKKDDLKSTDMSLLGGQGGLQNLVGQFTSKGLGDVVGSWVSTGKNLPVTGDQLQNVLGKDTIGNLASKLGMDKGALTSQLSNLLPDVVDKLTPDGKVPEGDIMSKGMDILGGLLGKK
ncbi:MAG TPA: YidB family protein [Ignavibacteriaceae bacterium]|nr:YidB family protein [Ignavibacteriaceae bacterium]